MKFQLVIIAVLVAISLAQDMDEDFDKKLKYFKKDQLSDNMRKYKIPETCGDVQKDCVKRSHEHAKVCIGLFFSGTHKEKIQDCKENNAEVKKVDKEWQESSLQWHKAVDKCLNTEELAPEEDAAASSLMFLFKRQAPNCETNIRIKPADEYANGRACMAHMKANKAKCTACVLQDTGDEENPGCSKYAACTGKGPTPSDTRLAAWHAHIAKLTENKKKVMKKTKRVFFTCLGVGASRARRHHYY